MSQRHNLTAVGAVWLGAVATLLAACGSGSAAAPGSPSAAASSPYATIANGKIDVEGGLVEVAARRAGVVRDVLVEEGTVVRKGQVLARLEDDDSLLAVNSARAAVAQAESQLALTRVNIQAAQREYQRLARLSASQVVAQQQIDQASDTLATAQAQLSVQQAGVQTARAQLAQAVYAEDLTIIRAPMDGRIVRRYANPGAGASTLNVSDMFDLEPASPHIARAEIVESAIPDVHVGQEAEIVSESDADKLSVGRVLRVAPVFGTRKLKSDTAKESTDERVVEVVVSADNTPYLIGQRVMVRFLKPGQKAGVKRDAPTAK
ncbi:MAG TPA: efflux RND transporter periplasmic adaptor subunit [Steroidobacteraceae bacterium]|nr:efflux RND transporter periplasmic adaptor subunit [Steroidobacteraceae bacterium]